MKNKLLKLIGGGRVRKTGKRRIVQVESKDWVVGQIVRMSELRQDLFSVRAVKQ